MRETNTGRREFLAAISSGSTIFLAGCLFGGDTDNSENNGQSPETTNTPPKAEENGSENSSNSDQNTGEAEQDTEAEETENDQEENNSPIENDPAIEFSQSELVAENAVELVAFNNGDGRSGQVSILSAWYDENGNFLGDDAITIPTLDEGTPIFTQISPTIPHSDRIADFELHAEADPHPPQSPDNMSVESSEYSEGNSEITGIVDNNRTETTSTGLLALLYNTSGWLIYWDVIYEDRIPANTDWSFKIPFDRMPPEVTADVADHQILLDENY